MFNVGMPELIVIFLDVLLLVGAKRLPEIGNSLGKAIKELKKASKDMRDETEDSSADHKGS